MAADHTHAPGPLPGAGYIHHHTDGVVDGGIVHVGKEAVAAQRLPQRAHTAGVQQHPVGLHRRGDASQRILAVSALRGLTVLDVDFLDIGKGERPLAKDVQHALHLTVGLVAGIHQIGKLLPVVEIVVVFLIIAFMISFVVLIIEPEIVLHADEFVHARIQHIHIRRNTEGMAKKPHQLGKLFDGGGFFQVEKDLALCIQIAEKTVIGGINAALGAHAVVKADTHRHGMAAGGQVGINGLLIHSCTPPL